MERGKRNGNRIPKVEGMKIIKINKEDDIGSVISKAIKDMEKEVGGKIHVQAQEDTYADFNDEVYAEVFGQEEVDFKNEAVKFLEKSILKHGKVVKPQDMFAATTEAMFQVYNQYASDTEGDIIDFTLRLVREMTDRVAILVHEGHFNPEMFEQ